MKAVPPPKNEQAGDARGDLDAGQRHRQAGGPEGRGEEAYVEVDSDDKIRRALFARSRPMRGPGPPGSLVYLYRNQKPVKGQHPVVGRWHGVCRVIGHDLPSGGAGRAQGHTIRLKYQGQQVLASPEQLRWATFEEIMAWNIPGDVATEIGAARHSRAT